MLAAAVFAALAASGPAQASYWDALHTIGSGEALQSYSSSETITHTVSESDSQKNALYLLQLVNNTEPLKADDFSLKFNLEGDGKTPVFGGVLYTMDGGLTTNFGGSETTLELIQTNQPSMDPDSSTAVVFVVGDVSYGDEATYNASTINFNAAKTMISGTSRGETGASLEGIYLGSKAAFNFTGKEVVLTVINENNKPAHTDGTDRLASYSATGINNQGLIIDGRDYGLTTSADTSMTINVTTTGDKIGSGYYDGAAIAAGLNAEGGRNTFGGDVEINVTAAGGNAYGGHLATQALDDELLVEEKNGQYGYTDIGRQVSWNHETTFEKNASIKVHSENGQATGFLLEGSCCSEAGSTLKLDDSVRSKVIVNGTMNLTVTKGSDSTKETQGFLFVETPYGGLGELDVNGTATITADQALTSEYWQIDDGLNDPSKLARGLVRIGDKGSLTLNGKVDAYHGAVRIDGGTLSLNSDTWFGGSVEVKGGSLKAQNAVYDTTAGADDLTLGKYLYIEGDADVSLKAMNIGNLGEGNNGAVTHAKMYGGSLSLESFSLAEGGKFGVNAGTITVSGTGRLAGKLRPTTVQVMNDLGIPGQLASDELAQPHSTATLVTKGSFTVENTGVLEINNLTVDGGTFTNLGKINGNKRDDGIDPTGDTLEVKNGGTFITLSGSESNKGVEHFRNIVLGSGSNWVNLLPEGDSTTLAIDSGANELEGGRFYYAASADGDRTEYKNFAVGNPDAAGDDAVLSFRSGTYELDSISIAERGQVSVGSAATVNLGNVTLDGGTLTLEGNVTAKGVTLNTSNADLFKSGSLTAEWIRFGETDAAEKPVFTLPDDYDLILVGDNEADESGQTRVATKVEGIWADIAVKSGTLDVLNSGSLNINALRVYKDAMLSANPENVSAHIILYEGAQFYIPVAPDNKRLEISHGSVSLRGNGTQLITSKDGSGHAESLEDTAPITEVVVSGTGAFYAEKGSHAFDKISLSGLGGAVVRGESTKLTVGELIIGDSSMLVGIGDGENSGGTLEVEKITFTDSSSASFTLNNGTLSTTSDQIFERGVMAEGQANTPGFITDPKSILNKDRWDFMSGTILFTDAKYNDIYSLRANNLINNKDVILNFTGDHVALNGQTDNNVGVDEMPDNAGMIYSAVTGTVSAGQGTDAATIDRSIGVQDLSVAEGASSVVIAEKKTVTLTGSSEGGEVIAFQGESSGDKTVDVKGGLVLGNQATDAGKLSQKVTLSDKASLTVKNGAFEVADVAASDGSALEVKAGSTSLAVNAGARTTVSSLVMDASSGKTEHTLTGSVGVTELAKKGGNESVIYVGTSGKEGVRGDLVLDKKVDSLSGLTFFLDPAYVDGKQITDGSRLVYQSDKIDGNIVAGENSYVVLGTSDDSALTAYFNEGKDLKWGSGKGEVLAAAYTDRPIKIASNGSLIVDGAVTTLADAEVVRGTASFGANSAFVVNVTNAEAGTVYLTANAVSVAEGARAVLVGKLDPTQTYKLSSDTTANVNWGENLYAGNAVWKLHTHADGTISVMQQDAGAVYGSLMQGSALAAAGMAAGSDYVNALLTDQTADPAKLAQIAGRFDAAMNPAGALSVFTTAYDRSSDLRRAVREEAVKIEGNRLWVHLTGGKTQLKGISTGSSQEIHSKTNAYGFVMGGEADVNGITAGAAFTAGRGDTKNSRVSGKDDFDFYGLSLYGRTTLAGVDVLADASGTWLRSDLTVGGAADVDADTTTAVYSAGVQLQKTFGLAGIDVTPFVGANVYHVAMNGFGNGHGASIKDSDATAVEFPVGASISKAFEAAGNVKVAPAFTLAVVPTVGDTDVDSEVRFAGASSTYSFTYTDDVKVRSNLGLDVTSQNLSLGLQAGYEWGNEERGAATFQFRSKYAF